MTKEWEKPEDLRRRKPVLWLTMTALFMAMVVVLSMSALSIPVPGGHLYFNDVVIDTAAMLMDPLSAFIACGVEALPEGSAAAGAAVVPACRSGDGAGVLPAGMGAVRRCIGSRGDWPECGAGHRGRADWDAVPADYAPAGARGEAVTNRDANGFPLWKTLASFFNDAEKSPDGRQIRRKMCYNSILEGDTLSPEAETRCKETLREIVR